MNTQLKIIRVKNHLTQVEMAKVLSTSKQTYQAVENGARQGSLKFWETVQAAFEIPAEEMWDLIHSVDED